MAKKPTDTTNLLYSALLNKIVDAAREKNKLSDTLTESKVMNDKDFFTTPIPAINVALSGEINGGFTPGLLVIAGPSKHFKTLYMLLLAKAYMDKYPKSIFVLFDSEFGASPDYFDSVGIVKERVVHVPVKNIEELKFQAMNILDKVERGEKVFIGLDSVGNIASKKEVDDALTGNSAADMTRAKQIKSLFRMFTPYLSVLDIPMVAINHTYQTQEMYSRAVVSGGTGIYYSANDIWIVGRSQEKNSDKEITGYWFDINIEKSRTVREKAKIKVFVSLTKGIDKYSGLLDLAVDGGFIVKPGKGVYALPDVEMEPVSEDETVPLIDQVLKNPEFDAYIKETFKQSGKMLVQTPGLEDDE